jgi:hypothetical protein
MLARMRSGVTYANAMATIALFVALGGGAYASIMLPAGSVGTRQLKKNAVTAKKIKNGAVSTRKLANGAVTKAKLNVSGVTVPNALHAAIADNAAHATGADSAAHATGADSAAHATGADNADNAAHATRAGDADNADKLGGVSPSGFESAIPVGEWAGQVGVIANSSTAFVFAGPTTSMTTNATQTVVASGSAALGAGLNASIELSICKQPTTGGAVTVLNPTSGGAVEDVTVTTTRHPFAISASGVPGAGTWNIGMCVEDDSPVDVDSSDWSIGWAMAV